MVFEQLKLAGTVVVRWFFIHILSYQISLQLLGTNACLGTHVYDKINYLYSLVKVEWTQPYAYLNHSTPIWDKSSIQEVGNI